jgi:hypothetical protein
MRGEKPESRDRGCGPGHALHKKKLAYNKQSVNNNYLVIRMMGSFVARGQEAFRFEGVTGRADSNELWKTAEAEGTRLEDKCDS